MEDRPSGPIKGYNTYIIRGQNWQACLEKIGQMIQDGPINVEGDNSIVLSTLRTTFIEVK